MKEEDYLRMDGSTDPQQRKRFTNAFNDPKETRFCHLLVCLKKTFSNCAKIKCESIFTNYSNTLSQCLLISLDQEAFLIGFWVMNIICYKGYFF